MRISTRGRYGIRILIDLAEHIDEDHTALASVAERQGISLRYLEQLVVLLKHAGLVRSVKGASGGYTLARPPGEIILGDILRTLEGDMLVADPPAPGVEESKLQRCVRIMVYDKLNAGIAELIDNRTLASVMDTAGSNGPDMYFI